MRSRATRLPLRISYGLSLLCLSLLSAFAQTSKPAATVSGCITDGEKPLPGITVTARDTTVRTSGVYDLRGRAVTDSDGRYRITDLSPGKYKIVPQHALYVVGNSEAGYGFNLTEGETVENVDFTLTKGGVITGRVTDYDGKAAVEQVVGLLRLAANGKWEPFYPRNFRMCQTDDRGDYRLYGLAEGQYKVFAGRAERDNVVYGDAGNNFRRQVFYPSIADEATAQVVEVKASEETNNLDIRLQGLFKTHDINVRVVDAQTGQPVAGVMCGFGRWSKEAKRTLGYMTGPVTAANGETLFQGVAPGTYAAFVNDAGNTYSENAIFEVTESEAPKVEVRLHRGQSISGQVVLLGANESAMRGLLRHVYFNVYSQAASEIASTNRSFTLNPDNTFFVNGVAPGEVNIQLGINHREAGFKVMGLEHQGVRKPGTLTLPSGSNLAEVKIYLLAPGQSSLRGQLQLISGVVPPGAITTIRLLTKNIPLLSVLGNATNLPAMAAQADQRGYFEFAKLYPGEYELQIELAALSVNNLTLQPLLPATKQTVQINEGSNQITVRIDLASQRKEGQ